MLDLLNTQELFIFIVIFGWLLILSYLFWKIYSHYTRLIGKSKRDDLKNILDKQLDTMSEVKATLSEVKKRLGGLEAELPNNIRKVGLVRFNPYREVGGNQSFSLALLDDELNGVVISALHGRNNTRIYAKPVLSGKESRYNLSDEEKEAVKVAKIIKAKK